MRLTKCDGRKAAGASFVLLLTLAAGASAQTLRKGTDLTRAEREAWYKILRWPAEYENAWRREHENSGYGGLSFYDLGRGKYLVEVDAYPVAYQTGFIYMLYDAAKEPNGPGRLLLLKGFQAEDERGRPLPYSKVSGFTSFDAKKKVLEVISKYRAAGDCGLYVRYKFVGPRPFVVEARERKCDAGRGHIADLDPSRWPRKKL
jgi:hypothetical protein